MDPTELAAQYGNHANDTNTNWLEGLNADSSPIPGVGPLPIFLDAKPGTYPNITAGLGHDPVLALAFNQHVFSNGFTVGTPEWAANADAFAATLLNQAAPTPAAPPAPPAAPGAEAPAPAAPEAPAPTPALPPEPSVTNTAFTMTPLPNGQVELKIHPHPTGLHGEFVTAGADIEELWTKATKWIKSHWPGHKA